MQNKEPFAFIFDMDGVLVDNMHVHARSWAELFHDFGLEGLDPDRYPREMGGMKGPDVLRHVLNPDITPEEADHLTEVKDLLYRFMYRNDLRPTQGLETFLDRSESLGVRLGVGTGAGARNIEFTLGIPAFQNRFEAVVGAYQVKRGKPHPDIYLRVAELLGTPPSRCIVFEDALPGIEAANAAGMRSIALATTNPPEIMQTGPGVMAVIDHFESLSPDDVLEKLSHALCENT